MIRCALVASLLGAAALTGQVAAAGPPAAAVVDYVAPLPAMTVLRPFDPPATPFGPGHLGVDLATRPGEPVRAAGAGVVSFAGPVAGRGVVVILHPDGVRTEYEPVRPMVSRGSAVRTGQVIARIAGRHGDCVPGGCLHWGARRGDAYFDPLLLLRRLGPVRLLPWRPD